jgi:hypothetical protein
MRMKLGTMGLSIVIGLLMTMTTALQVPVGTLPFIA